MKWEPLFCTTRAQWRTITTLPICLVILIGCDAQLNQPSTSEAEQEASTVESGSTELAAPVVSQPVAAIQPVYGESVAIGSYNIRVFGQSKLEDEAAMQVLTQVVYYFDIVGIQEIRSKEQDVIPRFCAMLNATGANFQYVVGPRIGRTSSKEQYAFLYDAARIELIGEPFTVPDPHDFVHREPLVAHFRVRTQAPNTGFTFALINVHTDPDEAQDELNALDDMYRYVRNRLSNEDDILILGDFNASETNLGELGQISGMSPSIYGVTTNTAGTKAYDNILYDRIPTTEFTGRAGVFPVDHEFGLDREQAMRVSDHFPVWAEFVAHETAGGRVASDTRSTR